MSKPIKFNFKQGLDLQALQLNEWKQKLNAECFGALKFHCDVDNAQKAFIPKVNGFAVLRGTDLTEFILNWKPSR